MTRLCCACCMDMLIEDIWEDMYENPMHELLLMDSNHIIGLGFTASLHNWNEIKWTESVLDISKANLDFSYHQPFVKEAQLLIKSLEETTTVTRNLFGCLLFIGANFYVVMAPGVGPGRSEQGIFYEEIQNLDG